MEEPKKIELKTTSEEWDKNAKQARKENPISKLVGENWDGMAGEELKSAMENANLAKALGGEEKHKEAVERAQKTYQTAKESMEEWNKALSSILDLYVNSSDNRVAINKATIKERLGLEPTALPELIKFLRKKFDHNIAVPNIEVGMRLNLSHAVANLSGYGDYLRIPGTNNFFFIFDINKEPQVNLIRLSDADAAKLEKYKTDQTL